MAITLGTTTMTLNSLQRTRVRVATMATRGPVRYCLRAGLPPLGHGMHTNRIVLACAVLFLARTPVEGQLVSGPVYSNAYITQGGLNWA